MRRKLSSSAPSGVIFAPALVFSEYSGTSFHLSARPLLTSEVQSSSNA